MKKSINFIILFVLPFVSAESDIAERIGIGLENTIEIVVRVLGPFFSALLGGAEEMLFERVLVLFIVISIVYMVVSKIESLGGGTPGDRNEAIVWTITLTVSILSTRFLSDYESIRALILPYSALGIFLSSIIPFIIFWKFIDEFDSPTFRRIGWIFFALVFIGLWIIRSDEVGSFSWIYLATAGLSFFFLLFDGTIRKILIKEEMKALEVRTRNEHIAKLMEELNDLYDNEKYWTDKKAFRRAVKDIERRIARARKGMFKA